MLKKLYSFGAMAIVICGLAVWQWPTYSYALAAQWYDPVVLTAGAPDAQTDMSVQIFKAHTLDEWAVSRGLPRAVLQPVGRSNNVCGATMVPTGAEFCSRTRKIYYSADSLSWMYGAGPIGLAFLLMHEYGHYMQDLSDPGLWNAPESVRIERQANCVAGAGIKWLIKTHPDLYTNAMVKYLQWGMRQSFADEMHGSAAAMSDAFDMGYDRNIQSCLSIAGPLASVS